VPGGKYYKEVNNMAKAKFIGKTYGTGYNRDFVYLEYEYRGHTYEVYENRAKGNEPLAWQHRNEQARIDRLIEDSEKPQKSNPIDWDEVFDMLYMEGKYAE
jgi:hypothetical protein